MPGLLEEPVPASDEVKRPSATTQTLPKGVVLGKDGKPCRTCTSTSDWLSMMKQSTTKKSSTPVPKSISSTIAGSAAAATTAAITNDSSSLPTDCPPDVEILGRSTWTLLHSLTASYPENPTPQHKSNVSSFLSLFSQLYPCWVCAEDFRDWMGTKGNEPKLSNPEEFGRWMCRAHNAVNVKLGKEEFNCDLWRERWKDGWRDGRCG